MTSATCSQETQPPKTVQHSWVSQALYNEFGFLQSLQLAPWMSHSSASAQFQTSLIHWDSGFSHLFPLEECAVLSFGSGFPKMWVTQPECLVDLTAPWGKFWSMSIKRRKGSKSKYLSLLPFLSHPSKFSSKEQWYNKVKFSSKNSGTMRPDWKVPHVTGPKTKPCFLGDMSLCICPPSFPPHFSLYLALAALDYCKALI